MEIVKCNELNKWKQEHPDAKCVIVEHGVYGKSKLTFNYAKPSDDFGVFKFGQYDAFGNFHFIDSEGTYHKCFKPNVLKYGTTSKKKYY